MIWRNAFQCNPVNYGKQFCLVQSADQGGEGLLYQRILHYDIKNNFWCDADPSCCISEFRKPIEWEVVRYWIPMEEIMKAVGWPTNRPGGQ